MSLNPSNMIAARDNPGRTMFPNLAGGAHDHVDRAVMSELLCAGILIDGPFESMRRGEVATAYFGNCCMWGFKRAWYYWVAEGPGVPADKAEEFHKTWGKQCRVSGSCACPSPLEDSHGFAIGSYHIDTQEGLTAFAELLKNIYVPDTRNDAA